MRIERDEDRVIAREDPLRWVTFSGFWGSIYYLLVNAGMIAGHREGAARINRRAAAVSWGIYSVVFVAGGVLLSLLEQLVVRRSSKEQSRRVIGSGLLEASIPLQALGGAVGAAVPFGMVIASHAVAERLTGEPVFEPGAIDYPRALAVSTVSSGLISFAVTRIAGWVAQDARHAKA